MAGPHRAAPAVLDAHVHVWRLGDRPQPWIDPVAMAVIDRDHEWAELAAGWASSGVTGAVLVQVLNDAEETDDLLALSAGGALGLLGVVGWTDLLAPRVGDELDRMLAAGALVGVRHQAQAEADPAAWLRRFGDGPGPAALAERDLACDLMLLPAELAVAADVVARHEGVRFVLDHAGKPPVVTGWTSPESQEWARLVSALGPLPHLTCKLSGLTTMADLDRWTVPDLAPYVDHLLAVFGPDRLVFGSDWPVSRRASAYARTVAAARDLVGSLSAAEQAAVLGGTAARVYGLDDGPDSGLGSGLSPSDG